jgi:hypothetical protein
VRNAQTAALEQAAAGWEAAAADAAAAAATLTAQLEEARTRVEASNGVITNNQEVIAYLTEEVRGVAVAEEEE